MVAATADVRDLQQISDAVAAGLDAFGHIDIVSANVGILGSGDFTWRSLRNVGTIPST